MCVDRFNFLGFKSDCFFSDAELAAISRVAHYDLEFVRWRIKYFGILSDERLSIAEGEFRRFVALTYFARKPLAMIGPDVDEFWHQAVLFTDLYREFCLNTVGFFIRHQPNSPYSPAPEDAGANFVEVYRRYFGTLPNVWYEGMSEEARRYYSQPVLLGKPPKWWASVWPGPETHVFE